MYVHNTSSAGTESEEESGHDSGTIWSQGLLFKRVKATSIVLSAKTLGCDRCCFALFCSQFRLTTRRGVPSQVKKRRRRKSLQRVNIHLRIHVEDFLGMWWLNIFWVQRGRLKNSWTCGGWKQRRVLSQQGMMGNLFSLIWLLNSLRLCAQSWGFTRELWTFASINEAWYKAHRCVVTHNTD